MTKQKHFYFLRGLIREQEHWGPFIPHMKTQFPDAKFSLIDIPGAGTKFLNPSPGSIGGMVEEMRREYHSKNHEDFPILVATSLGGMIGLEWLKRYPKDFSQVFFLNTSFGGVSPVHHRLLPQALLYLLKVPFLKGRQKEAHILKLVSNHGDVFEETLNHWEKIQKERPVSLRNTIVQLLAGAKYSAPSIKPDVPVYLIASTTDRMVSVECSRAIAKKWNVPIHEHPTGGHDLTVDDPKWVALKIKEISN